MNRIKSTPSLPGTHGLLPALCCLLLALAPGALRSQTFTSFNLPTHYCIGQTRTITFGFGNQANVVVAPVVSTLNSADTAFLPDGEPCAPHGCSYRSPITFTDFPATSHISSLNDIKYVRLNIEHSFIGDLYINITCPNGQKADLMRFGGSLNSDCSDYIPASSVDWLDGDNISNSTYFGEPVDEEDSETCDASAYDNRPGVGWNYCWSNNSNSGYSYAPGDAIIYRDANSSDGESIDSSDVANHSNFYHPDEDFSSLIGCPLNGAWYIEVIDGWGGDNGYIFDWELSLDPSLLPVACDIDSRSVLGSIVQRLNDSTYRIIAPATIPRDTVIPITFRAISACGDTADSIARITIHVPPVTNIDSTVCDSIIFGGDVYRTSQLLQSHITTFYGCDSTVHLNLTVNRSSVLDTVVDIVETDLPFTICGQTFTSDVDSTIRGFTNAADCDSAVHLRLHVLQVWHTTVDTTLCQHQIPLHWNGRDISLPDTYVDSLVTSHGEDSIVTLNLTVRPDNYILIQDTLIENLLPAYMFGGIAFWNDTDTTVDYTNQWGCDSIVHYQLKVWHNVNQQFDTLFCGEIRTRIWKNVEFSRSADTLLELHTSHGADSNVSLHVVMASTYYIGLDTTICDGDTARVAWFEFSDNALIKDTLLTVAGCDSIMDIDVRIGPNYELPDSIPFCPGLPLTYMDSIYPVSTAFDTLLTTIYGCDSLVHVKLQRIDSLFAPAFLIGDTLHWSADTTLAGCPPFLVALRDTTPLAAQWQWVLGDGDTITGYDITTHAYDSVGFFSPKLLVVSEHGCRDSAQLDSSVWVIRRPRAAFEWEERYPGNHRPETQFRNLTAPSSCTYLWEIQSLGTSGYDTTSAVSPFYSWDNGTDIPPAGGYEVRLIAFWSQPGPDSTLIVCSDTTTDTVTIVNTFLEFPNLVTPDGDGYNDRWVVVNLLETDIYTMNEVWIYDHWGVRVFHARDITSVDGFWDPNQTNSPDGTYYFRFSARSRYGVVKRNGTIEVMRGGR